ncbi:50S ribosomal protein L1 [Euphorbia peplus]|nr:50S ribosomal protein L1 [Euphorbia peplus]
MKKVVFSHLRRQKTLTPISSWRRCYSSDSYQPPPPIVIQPVSYPAKPKDDQTQKEFIPPPPQFHTTPDDFPNQDPRDRWTREDIRYVKDAPFIAPVSYPKRVAPLPEDRVVPDENEMRMQEMESRRIQLELMATRRAVEAVEEEVKIPFPKLIKKSEKKEKKAVFDLMEAIRQVKANARTTFDETIEAHVRLGIPSSRSDLIVRGSLTLPHGGKKVLRIAVFAEGADADEARAAGADVVGGSELIDEILQDGKVDFDKCYTTTQFFPRVVKLARILNNLGLMPDAKQGTVVSNVSVAVKEAKKEQIKFRMDKSSIVHVGLGKASFTEEVLRENVGALMNALLQAKPAGLKKTSKYVGYVSTFHICSTMGKGFPVSIQSLSKAEDHYNKVYLKPRA